MSIYQDPKDFIKYELLCCWIQCEAAHKDAMKPKIGKAIASTYALSAQNHLASIKSVYTCNYSKLANDSLETLIHQMSTFCEELLTSYCTNHSYQWTDIEFNRLKELVESSEFIKS